jgi:hypothetical protein
MTSKHTDATPSAVGDTHSGVRDGHTVDVDVHDSAANALQREGAVLLLAEVALDALKRRTTSAPSSANAIVISRDEWTGLVDHYSDVLAIACAHHLEAASGRRHGRTARQVTDILSCGKRPVR